MSLLVVGSMALDTVKTPFGEIKEGLGGSATFFSVAASFFTDVKLVAIVGEDFPKEHLNFLTERGIDLEGLTHSFGKTFRWQGEYTDQMNEAKTLKTDLNVFETFHPKLPVSYQNIPYLFLANIEPGLQMDVLQQVKSAKLTACDTMNFWIESSRERLKNTLANVDLAIINEGEARALSSERNLMKAAKTILAMGPERLIIKRGEYGAMMFTKNSVFAVPAYPLETVSDPTGAGDSFAGGLMGYLASKDSLDDNTFRQAVLYGSVMASFSVEAFSLDRMRTLTEDEINVRYTAFQELTAYESV